MFLTLDKIKPGMRFRFTPARVAEFNGHAYYGVTQNPDAIYTVLDPKTNLVFTNGDQPILMHYYNHHTDKKHFGGTTVRGADFLRPKPTIIICSK